MVLLLFDGQAQWFHSMNSRRLVLALYDHVDGMLEADGVLPPPPALAPYHFTASSWQPRPDGQPVDDFRPRRRAHRRRRTRATATPRPGARDAGTPPAWWSAWSPHDRAPPALPRKNGELVFDGAVAGAGLRHGGGAVTSRGPTTWEEFRQELIAQVAAAEARGGPFEYYEVWLATFEASSPPRDS